MCTSVTVLDAVVVALALIVVTYVLVFACIFVVVTRYFNCCMCTQVLCSVACGLATTTRIHNC